MSALVEAMARAICRESFRGDVRSGQLDRFVDDSWHGSIDLALACLRAMAEVVPSDRMLEAADACATDANYNDCTVIYRAMLRQAVAEAENLLNSRASAAQAEKGRET